MKSIKPGRGPSFMSGVASVAVGLFGVIWTASALSMGAPVFFALFGVVFIILAVAMAIYEFRNAVGTNRHSLVDIVEDGEEPDPLNQRFGDKRYCPFCGETLPENARFCPACGKELPLS